MDGVIENESIPRLSVLIGNRDNPVFHAGRDFLWQCLGDGLTSHYSHVLSLNDTNEKPLPAGHQFFGCTITT